MIMYVLFILLFCQGQMSLTVQSNSWSASITVSIHYCECVSTMWG